MNTLRLTAYKQCSAWLLSRSIHMCEFISLESINDWTLSIQYRHSVTVAYVDFSKAFDSVSHEGISVV